jgi:SAM-dependent methyltransferase
MNERIESWNERYSRREGVHEFAPSPPLPWAVEGLQPGLALDIASGAGRHSIFLAERGWRVVAVEGARAGIELMMEEARRRSVASLIEAREVDLEADPPLFAIEPDRYDLVCDFYYLDRSRFPQIRDGVRPGGLFVAAIHLEDASAERPMNPSFLLAPGEFRSIVEGWGWEVLHAHEGHSRDGGHHRGTAEIVARKPGVRGQRSGKRRCSAGILQA